MAKKRTIEADVQLDDRGRPIDEDEADFGENVIIVGAGGGGRQRRERGVKASKQELAAPGRVNDRERRLGSFGLPCRGELLSNGLPLDVEPYAYCERPDLAGRSSAFAQRRERHFPTICTPDELMGLEAEYEG